MIIENDMPTKTLDRLRVAYEPSLSRLVRVGDLVTAQSGAKGVVREVCGLGVWIDCEDPTPFSSAGNPVGVDWKDIVSWEAAWEFLSDAKACSAPQCQKCGESITEPAVHVDSAWWCCADCHKIEFGHPPVPGILSLPTTRKDV